MNTTDALQVMKEMIELPPEEVKERIIQMPAQVFLEGARALYDYFDKEMEDLRKQRNEQLKGYDLIMKTAHHILTKQESELTAEDRMVYFNAMREANDKRTIAFEKSKVEEDVIKWIKRGTVVAGVASFIGLAIAYIAKKK